MNPTASFAPSTMGSAFAAPQCWSNSTQRVHLPPLAHDHHRAPHHGQRSPGSVFPHQRRRHTLNRWAQEWKWRDKRLPAPSPRSRHAPSSAGGTSGRCGLWSPPPCRRGTTAGAPCPSASDAPRTASPWHRRTVTRFSPPHVNTYAEGGQWKAAVAAFEQMHAAGLKPDDLA